MAIEAEAKTVPYDVHSAKVPSALSEEARAALQEFGEKYSDLIENADALSQPMRGIAEFVKKEGGREDQR